jgi:hypothetical protein
MTNERPVILQIVPRLPNGRDGVADYASKLAKGLSEQYGITTVFAPAEMGDSGASNDFKTVPLNRISAEEACDHLILHFVNYGYQRRGVPFQLLSILRAARRNCRGKFVTIFHELYASAPFWQSAFWLRPFQIYIARQIAQLSDISIVSNPAALDQLRKIAPGVRALVHPVFSNFGEPQLSREEIADRDPHRWVICGGTELVLRSLRSFQQMKQQIPEWLSPRELLVLGGADDQMVRAALAQLTGVRTIYHPRITAVEASPLLASATFAWLDYFHRPNVPAAAILKSSVFAAACAHGLIPVSPHGGSAISLAGSSLPGPYFVEAQRTELPSAGERARIAGEFYDWYRQHASSPHLVREIAEAIGLTR